MIKTRTHHGHHGLTAQKNNLLVPSLSFKHLAVRGVLFCFHSCAPKREQRATFFTSSSLSRHLLFLSKSSFRMRGGSDTTQHKKSDWSRSFVCPWTKAMGKRSCQSNVKDIQRSRQKHEANWWSFWRSLFQNSRFWAVALRFRRSKFCFAVWSAMKRRKATAA